MNLWFNEYKLTMQNDLNNCCEPNLNTVGHFTQLATQDVTHVRCAIAIYENEKLFVCNYSHSELLNQSVYQCGPVAQKCWVSHFPALCGT